MTAIVLVSGARIGFALAGILLAGALTAGLIGRRLEQR